MFTQESSYLYALAAALAVAVIATLLVMFWALRGFQVYW
jgi:hypothetical protein